MTTRIQDNLMKGIFFMILFTILLLQSLLTNAQSRRAQETYRGFYASFATVSQTVSSNIAKIDQNNLLQTGGKVGVVYGNSAIRSKLGLLGYYSSSANTPGEIDLYVSNLSINVYPLSWITKKDLMIEPYITGGLDYNQYKFYGFYFNREPGVTNYSQMNAPYLGKIKQVNATAGLGIEVKLRDRFDFVHLFSELKYGYNLSTKTTDSALSGTNISGQSQFVFGISFGAHR